MLSPLFESIFTYEDKKAIKDYVPLRELSLRPKSLVPSGRDSSRTRVYPKLAEGVAQNDMVVILILACKLFVDPEEFPPLVHHADESAEARIFSFEQGMEFAQGGILSTDGNTVFEIG